MCGGRSAGNASSILAAGMRCANQKALSTLLLVLVLVQQWRLWCRGRKDNLVSCAYALCDQQVLQHEIHI